MRKRAWNLSEFTQFMNVSFWLESQRDRLSNQKEAFMNCVNSDKFQAWLRIRIAEELSREAIDEKVEKAMAPKNLKVEIRENGKWITE